jgi:hypothetical protein
MCDIPLSHTKRKRRKGGSHSQKHLAQRELIISSGLRCSSEQTPTLLKKMRLSCSTVNKDVVSTSKLLVPVYQTTELRIPEDSSVHSLFIIVFTTARIQLSHQNQFQETPEKAFRKLRESSLVWHSNVSCTVCALCLLELCTLNLHPNKHKREIMSNAEFFMSPQVSLSKSVQLFGKTNANSQV